ncbi:MAG: hypothetical protein KJ906_00180 [Nanoarchaeota archaeon]|nr:hypothetical protein [Nanoarchaeota archaeon]
MRINNLMICFIIVTILISLSSVSVFAQEITSCVESEKSITVSYDDGYVKTLTDKCGYSSGSGEYGFLHYFCGTVAGGDPYYWIEFTQCNCQDAVCVENTTAADLKVEKITYTFDNNDNPKKIYYYIKVSNVGSAATQTFGINPQIPQLSVYVDNVCGSTELLPGETCTETGYGYLSDGSSLKTVRTIDIIATVDPQNQVIETNEANNMLSTSITMIPNEVCDGVICQNEYTCIKSAYQVCLLKSKVDQCSAEDGPVYENCYVYNYYQAPMMEYLYDYSGNRFMISEVSGETAKIKAIDPDTNVVLEYWVSTTEPKSVLSGKNTMFITIDSIFYDLNPPFGSKDRVSLRVQTPSNSLIEEESEITPVEEESEGVIIEPIGSEETIYGTYAELGEMFKLQERQPVKIVDYLDKNNNPLKIYLWGISKYEQTIKLEVLFEDKSETITLPLTEAKPVFGAVINFISIDDSWKYATLRVSYTGQTLQVDEVAVARVKQLETIKSKVVGEKAVEIETVQEEILKVSTDTDTFEKEIDERGFGYRFKWFFGMVVEQEKEDAEFLKSQGQRLIKTADLLLEISKQVDEPAKSILVEQAESLQEQAGEILKKAEKKENSAKGMFSWFG